MALLRHLRVHQVFGANTDVGKSVATTALLAAAVRRNIPAFYLKPVSTGPPADADDLKIQSHTKGAVRTACLFRLHDPVSPHLAARRSPADSMPSDRTFLAAISSHIRRCASRSAEKSHMYIETAGGVHSPTLRGTSQADCYRPLFLPTVLVGDPRLGGISATIAAYESLLVRGYIVDAVLLFKDEYYRNWEYLTDYFADRRIHVGALAPPPPLTKDRALDQLTTSQYYDAITSEHTPDHILNVVDHLDACHTRRIDELASMPARALHSIWWPFVQHGLISGERDVTPIDSAHSDFFSVYRGDPLSVLEQQVDGSASWWTQAVGHSHPRLTLAAARAAGRYGHVMFPQHIHAPALKLAESLLAGPGKNWASRAFFTDNGSTGMEVALKMALRSYTVNNPNLPQDKKTTTLGVLGLKGSYHGDTIGAMDACESNGVYTCEWHRAKGFWFDPPTVAIRQGTVTITLPSCLGGTDIEARSLQSVYNVAARMHTRLASQYRAFIRDTLHKLSQDNRQLQIAALVLEPLLMGAGGMIFVDPLFQRIMVDVAREESGLPVIFDEVFVGLYRLGMESTAPLLGVNPDISVNAKILTGGLVPLAVTLASESVFNAFLSESKADALLHGHSYTAHAVGCEVANETLDMIDGLKRTQPWIDAKKRWNPADAAAAAATTTTADSVWSFWDPDFVKEMSKAHVVQEAMALGTVLVIKFRDGDNAGYVSRSAETLLQSLRRASTSDEASYSVNYRTLGNVAYFMTSLNTSEDTIRSLEDRIWASVHAKQ